MKHKPRAEPYNPLLCALTTERRRTQRSLSSKNIFCSSSLDKISFFLVNLIFLGDKRWAGSEFRFRKYLFGWYSFFYNCFFSCFSYKLYFFCYILLFPCSFSKPNYCYYCCNYVGNWECHPNTYFSKMCVH